MIFGWLDASFDPWAVSDNSKAQECDDADEVAHRMSTLRVDEKSTQTHTAMPGQQASPLRTTGASQYLKNSWPPKPKPRLRTIPALAGFCKALGL